MYRKTSLSYACLIACLMLVLCLSYTCLISPLGHRHIKNLHKSPPIFCIISFHKNEHLQLGILKSRPPTHRQDSFQIAKSGWSTISEPPNKMFTSKKTALKWWWSLSDVHDPLRKFGGDPNTGIIASIPSSGQRGCLPVRGARAGNYVFFLLG